MKIVLINLLLCLSIMAKAVPVITSFAPASASIGSTVTINGSGFNTTPANNIVWFGAVKATVSASTETSITVTVPTGATYAPISVLNTDNALTAFSLACFIPTFSPSNTDIIAGNYASAVNLAAGSMSWGASIGDLDGDGKPDLAVTNNGSGTVSVFRNKGGNRDACFETKTDFITGAGPYDLTIGDLDGDGKPELVIANNTGLSISILRNTSSEGAVNFADKFDMSTTYPAHSAIIRDFDSDGKPDIAVLNGNYNNGIVTVFRNTSMPGTLSFATAVSFSVKPNPAGLGADDINKDGKIDLVTGGYNLVYKYVTTLCNTSTPGTISFAQSANFSELLGNMDPTYPSYLAVGDLENDGLPDVAVSYSNYAPVIIFRNNNRIDNGYFYSQGVAYSGSIPGRLALADIDGNGKLDLITSLSSSNSLTVRRNTSSSTSNILWANSSVTYSTGTNPFGLALGDLDGDGKPDMVATSMSGGAFILFSKPFITSLSPLTINDLSTPAGLASSSKTFTIKADALSNNPLVVTAPTGFEVRQNGTGNFSSSVSIAPASGKVDKTIEVRISALAPLGTVSGNVICSSSGAVSQNVAVSGIVLKPLEVSSTSGNTAPTDYGSLKEAFDAINTGIHQGEITIKLNGSPTETASAVLNASGSGSASYSAINIYPAIAGLSITGNIAAPLIDLNGAKNITIDGRANRTGASKDLTISNASTSSNPGTSTLRFINDASDNLVKYCTIKGSSTDATAAILFFSTTNGVTGNDNNIIDNNNITNSANANRPVNAVYSAGTIDKENNAIVISNNNIYDFLNKGTSSQGILFGDNTTACTISGNSFYETASFTPAAAATYQIISISNIYGTGFSINNNYIGGSAAMCGSSAWTKTNASDNPFTAIYLNVGTAIPSNIQGNTIRNFSYSNSLNAEWSGIYCMAGDINIGTTTGNTIGAATGNGSVYINARATDANYYGIYTGSTGISTIQNNIIGSVALANSANNASRFYGIYKSKSEGVTYIRNNTIGSTITLRSINVSGTSPCFHDVYGIYSDGTGAIIIADNSIVNLFNGPASNNSTTGFIKGIYTNFGTVSITGNTVKNLLISNKNEASDHTAAVIGISQVSTASAAQNVSGNTVSGLSNDNTLFKGSIIGIYYNGNNTASRVTENFISSLLVNSSSTAANIYGIKIAAGTTTYANNIISLGGNSKTNVYGIYETGDGGNTNNLYFNTVYIGGNVTAGTNNSYALYSAANTSTRNFRNNIFTNVRSTTGGSNLHYAAYFAATGGTLSCDYNNYYVSGTGGTLGYYGVIKTSLPLATGDAGSRNADPGFAAAGGSTPASYLPSSVNLIATPGTGIINDYDNGDARNPAYPAMGAYEYNVTPATFTWNGLISSDWHTPGNWSSNMVPAATDNVIIPALYPDPVVNPASLATAACNHLTIEPGAVLTVAQNKTLTINGVLTNSNKAGLIIESDGSLIQNSNDVAATVKRTINDATDDKWHLFISPLTGSIQASASSCFYMAYLDNYDEPTGAWIRLLTNEFVEPDKGYAINYMAGNRDLVFTGTLKESPVTYSNLSYLAPEINGDYGRGWNLVGNPYTCSINPALCDVPLGINAFAYVWDGENGNYTPLSIGSASIPGIIAPLQGFFVRTNSATNLFTLANASKTHGGRFMKASDKLSDILRISIQGNQYSDVTYIRFEESATADFDQQYDAYKLAGLQEAPQLYSILPGENAAVNTLPGYTSMPDIPLGLKVGATNTYTLHVEGINCIDPANPIRLDDLKLGTSHDLRLNPSYSFTAAPNDSERRFQLSFTSITNVNELKDNGVKIYAQNGGIHITHDFSGSGTAYLYSASGQLLAKSTLNNDATVLQAPANGIYLVKVVTGKISMTRKLIVTQ